MRRAGLITVVLTNELHFISHLWTQGMRIPKTADHWSVCDRSAAFCLQRLAAISDILEIYSFILVSLRCSENKSKNAHILFNRSFHFRRRGWRLEWRIDSLVWEVLQSKVRAADTWSGPDHEWTFGNSSEPRRDWCQKSCHDLLRPIEIVYSFYNVMVCIINNVTYWEYRIPSSTIFSAH